MSTYSLNSTIAVARQLTTGTPPGTGEYAIGVYQVSSGYAVGVPPVFDITFGPNEGIPSTITFGSQVYTFSHGVVFKNTP